MKKLAFLLVVLLIGSVSVPALDISAGLGGSIEANSTELNAVGKYYGYTDTANIKSAYTPMGVHAFFDSTFVELSAGYQMRMIGSGTIAGTGIATTTTNINVDYSYLAFQGLAKYPFKLGKVRLFPLLGAAYALNLTVTDSASGTDLKSSLSTQERSDLNEIWLKGGVGFDFPVGKFFLRSEGLIGFRLLTQAEKNTISSVQNAILSAGYTSADVTISNLAFAAAVMIGYTF